MILVKPSSWLFTVIQESLGWNVTLGADECVTLGPDGLTDGRDDVSMWGVMGLLIREYWICQSLELSCPGVIQYHSDLCRR